MHIGKGHLILRDGRRLPVNFQFGSTYDEVRSGYLHLDTSRIDPACYGDRLDMICEDGTEVRLVIIHFSDRYLAFSGRSICAAA